MQAVVGMLTDNWLAGASLGAAFFIGREHTQAEYRNIEKYCQGKRANMPWWGGFDPKVWSADSMLDWIFPVAAVSIAVFFSS